MYINLPYMFVRLYQNIMSLPEHVRTSLYIGFLRSIIYVSASLFLPLYLYNKYGIAHAIIFLALQYSPLHTYLSVLTFIYLDKKINFERLQILSVFLGIAGIFIIYLNNLVVLYIISPLLLNMSEIVYSISKHYVLTIYGKKYELGEEFADLELFSRVVYIVMPFLSGIFIFFVGYEIFYFVLGLLAAIFLITLYISTSYHPNRYVNRNILYEKDLKLPHSILFINEGVIYGISLYVLTLFLFKYASNTAIYGSLKFLVGVVSLFLIYFVGRYVDRRKNYFLVFIMVFIMSFLLVTIFKINNALAIVILISMFNLALDVFVLPVNVYVYNTARSHLYGIIWKRELFLSIGRFIVFIFLFLLGESVLLILILSFLIFSFIFRHVLVDNKRGGFTFTQNISTFKSRP